MPCACRRSFTSLSISGSVGPEIQLLQYLMEAYSCLGPPGKSEHTLGRGLLLGKGYDDAVAVREFLAQTGVEVGEAGNNPVPLDAALELAAFELRAGAICRV